VQFEMDTGEGQALDPNDPTLKSMREAAKPVLTHLPVSQDSGTL